MVQKIDIFATNFNLLQPLNNQLETHFPLATSGYHWSLTGHLKLVGKSNYNVHNLCDKKSFHILCHIIDGMWSHQLLWTKIVNQRQYCSDFQN